MEPSVETQIWMALKTHLLTYVTPHPVLMPAQKTIQPGTDLPVAYWRVGRVVAEPVNILVDHGKKHQRTGFLMVTLVEPINQEIEVFDNKAGKMAGHFVDGTNMHYGDVCVTVTDYPYVMDAYEESGYWETPVRIPWRCFA